MEFKQPQQKFSHWFSRRVWAPQLSPGSHRGPAWVVRLLCRIGRLVVQGTAVSSRVHAQTSHTPRSRRSLCGLISKHFIDISSSQQKAPAPPPPPVTAMQVTHHSLCVREKDEHQSRTQPWGVALVWEATLCQLSRRFCSVIIYVMLLFCDAEVKLHWKAGSSDLLFAKTEKKWEEGGKWRGQRPSSPAGCVEHDLIDWRQSGYNQYLCYCGLSDCCSSWTLKTCLKVEQSGLSIFWETSVYAQFFKMPVLFNSVPVTAGMFPVVSFT